MQRPAGSCRAPFQRAIDGSSSWRHQAFAGLQESATWMPREWFCGGAFPNVPTESAAPQFRARTLLAPKPATATRDCRNSCESLPVSVFVQHQIGQVQVLSFETANCWLDPPAQPHTQGCTVGAVHVAGIDTANIPLTFVRSNREPTTQDPRTLFQQSRRHLGSALHTT